MRSIPFTTDVSWERTASLGPLRATMPMPVRIACSGARRSWGSSPTTTARSRSGSRASAWANVYLELHGGHAPERALEVDDRRDGPAVLHRAFRKGLGPGRKRRMERRLLRSEDEPVALPDRRLERKHGPFHARVEPPGRLQARKRRVLDFAAAEQPGVAVGDPQRLPAVVLDPHPHRREEIRQFLRVGLPPTSSPDAANAGHLHVCDETRAQRLNCCGAAEHCLLPTVSGNPFHPRTQRYFRRSLSLGEQGHRLEHRLVDAPGEGHSDDCPSDGELQRRSFCVGHVVLGVAPCGTDRALAGAFCRWPFATGRTSTLAMKPSTSSPASTYMVWL